MTKKKNAVYEYLFHGGKAHRAYEYLGCTYVRHTSTGIYEYFFRVWAPNADKVFVVGDFCGWDDGIPMERITEKGIWEASFSFAGSLSGNKYKYRILSGDRVIFKGDPYAQYSEGGASGATVICDRSRFRFTDGAWLDLRASEVCAKDGRYLCAPLNIYEVHLCSFMRHDDGSYLTYRELADILASYVKGMGYTHVELLPIAEYPYDASWGYQVCGFFAPTSRMGTPDDFRYFVNTMHRAGVGVILDWVPAHFPKDEWGLYEFDGKPLYEYQGYDRMESPSWGTRFFDLGREEVRSFLLSCAMFWIDEFHIDGLRVDAVASMLYLDYDRRDGGWIPNIYGENKNLEAQEFIRNLNTAVFERHPDVLMIAEESTAWPMVTRPVSDGGLGFNLKWNMGFANDFFDYLKTDPIFRKYKHGALNFPIVYAFSENFVLPVSHDEVVHGKGSYIGKMFGSYEDKFKQYRAAEIFRMTFPGKKLMFMGSEYGQFSEWDFSKSLEWFMLDFEKHSSLQCFEAALNRFYLSQRALWELDFDPEGFEWIYPDAADINFAAYRRFAMSGEYLTVAVSFSGSRIAEMKLPVKSEGEYEVAFGSDSDMSGLCFESERDENGDFFIAVDFPPFCAAIIRKKDEISEMTV